MNRMILGRDESGVEMKLTPKDETEIVVNSCRELQNDCDGLMNGASESEKSVLSHLLRMFRELGDIAVQKGMSLDGFLAVLNAINLDALADALHCEFKKKENR